MVESCCIQLACVIIPLYSEEIRCQRKTRQLSGSFSLWCTHALIYFWWGLVVVDVLPKKSVIKPLQKQSVCDLFLLLCTAPALAFFLKLTFLSSFFHNKGIHWATRAGLSPPPLWTNQCNVSFSWCLWAQRYLSSRQTGAEQPLRVG